MGLDATNLLAIGQFLPDLAGDAGDEDKALRVAVGHAGVEGDGTDQRAVRGVERGGRAGAIVEPAVEVFSAGHRHGLVGGQGRPGAARARGVFGAVVARQEAEVTQLGAGAGRMQNDAIAVGEVDDVRHVAQGGRNPDHVGPGDGQQVGVGLQPAFQVVVAHPARLEARWFWFDPCRPAPVPGVENHPAQAASGWLSFQEPFPFSDYTVHAPLPHSRAELASVVEHIGVGSF